MKRVTTLGAAVALVLGLGGPAGAAERYAIDPVHTTAIFKIEHLGVSYFYGRFNEVKGSFVWAEDPAESEVSLTIPVESVDTNNARRDRHLKGPDFFNAVEFPAMTFESTEIAVKEGEDGVYEVTGALTLHGVTKEVTIDVEHVGAGEGPQGNLRRGFDATFTLSRSEFGIDYMPGGLGDEVRIHFGVEGIHEG